MPNEDRDWFYGVVFCLLLGCIVGGAIGHSHGWYSGEREMQQQALSHDFGRLVEDEDGRRFEWEAKRPEQSRKETPCR